MDKYILGNRIIETTLERYNTVFKKIGYLPYSEEKNSKSRRKGRRALNELWQSIFKL